MAVSRQFRRRKATRTQRRSERTVLRAVQLVLEGGKRYPAPCREAGAGAAEDVDERAFQCHGNNVGPAGLLRSGNGGLTGGVPFIARGDTARYGKGTDSDATDTFI